MLAHSKDLRSLFFIGMDLGLIFFSLGQPFRFQVFLFLPLIFFFSYVAAIINHNHMHNEMFRSDFLNILVNILLSLCTGLPVSLIYAPHVLNHHRYNGGAEDWGGVHVAGDARGVGRVFRAIWQTHLRTGRLRPRPLSWGLPPWRKLSLSLEILALLIFIGAACWQNAGAFFLIVLPGWLLAVNSLLFVNFLLHDDCELESEFHHSHNFTSRLGNYFLFNSGYHLAHHERPKKHWSELRLYHTQNLQDKVAAPYVHNSLLAFIARKYLR